MSSYNDAIDLTESPPTSPKGSPSRQRVFHPSPKGQQGSTSPQRFAHPPRNSPPLGEELTSENDDSSYEGDELIDYFQYHQAPFTQQYQEEDTDNSSNDEEATNRAPAKYVGGFLVSSNNRISGRAVTPNSEKKPQVKGLGSCSDRLGKRFRRNEDDEDDDMESDSQDNFLLHGSPWATVAESKSSKGSSSSVGETKHKSGGHSHEEYDNGVFPLRGVKAQSVPADFITSIRCQCKFNPKMKMCYRYYPPGEEKQRWEYGHRLRILRCANFRVTNLNQFRKEIDSNLVVESTGGNTKHCGLAIEIEGTDNFQEMGFVYPYAKHPDFGVKYVRSSSPKLGVKFLEMLNKWKETKKEEGSI